VHINDNVASTASSELVGSGINLPDQLSSLPWKDALGNEIVWRQVRTFNDNRGGRHVLYRQYLRSAATEAELFGSEIGLHYTKSGTLWSIAGRQFTSIKTVNLVGLSAAAAANRVLSRLQSYPGFRPETPEAAAPHLAWRVANSLLKVVYTPTGFRYAWFTFAGDSQGIEYKVVMDAQTEDILAVGELIRRSNCQPTTPSQIVSATGIPVRPELSGIQRSLRANIASDRTAPFTYEAYDSTGTHITIVQETGTQAFKCDQAATRSYTLVPLLADNGSVVYRDRPDQPEWRGSAAGDALYNTMQTLSAFSSLGRNGWNGLNGDANVVLDSTYGGAGTDAGFFRMTGSGDPRVPPTPFLGILASQNYYNMAAALDAIAHEWGHGVIFTSSANFPCVTPNTVPCQLHEGFADVIGQIVEKLKQPAGSGLELSSDWTIHEDNATAGYVRGALDDGDSGHTWIGLNGFTTSFNQAVHRQDADGSDPLVPQITQDHLRGNMLNMALRLLVEGGTNPICTRHPEYGGCATTVNGQLTKGGQILFDTVQFYAPSTAQWADLATYASQAAFDLYSDCTAFPKYEAGAEQNSVNQAFTAIGYPRLTAANRCP